MSAYTQSLARLSSRQFYRYCLRELQKTTGGLDGLTRNVGKTKSGDPFEYWSGGKVFAPSPVEKSKPKPKARPVLTVIEPTKREETKMIERTEYKGNPVLVIKKQEDDKYPFSFGLTKARLILEHIEDIRAFVADAGRQSKAA